VGFPTWLHFSPLPSSLMDLSSQYKDSQLRAPGWTFASPLCLRSLLGVVPPRLHAHTHAHTMGMFYFRFTVYSVLLIACLKINKEYVCTLVSVVKGEFYMAARIAGWGHPLSMVVEG
jgi:hypothetical protein